MSQDFFQPPNYTAVPNDFFDDVLPQGLSKGELTVTLAIFRETFGWRRRETKLLSLDEIQAMTGLSRPTATDGLNAAMERGYIKRRKAGYGYVYGVSVKKPEPVKKLDSDLSKEIEPRSIGPKEKVKGDSDESPKDVEKKRKKSPGKKFEPQDGSRPDAAIVAVYELWVEHTPQPDGTVLTNSRAGKIRARLAEQEEGAPAGQEPLEHGFRALREAVLGWASSDWHQREGAFDFLTGFRSRDKVDAFRGRYHKSRNGNGKPDRSAYDAAIKNRGATG